MTRPFEPSRIGYELVLQEQDAALDAMSVKSPAEKARVRPDATFAVGESDAELADLLGFPASVRKVPPAEASILCVAIRTRRELETEMPRAVEQLASGAHLWVMFRKGSSAAGHDVNRDAVWHAADAQGLKPIGLISVDDTWSVFRLRR